MVQSGQTTSYVYTADGARLIQRTPTAVTLFLGDTELKLNTGTGVVDGTRYYAGVAVRAITGLAWLAAERHGSNQLAIDATTLNVTRRRSQPLSDTRGTSPGTWPGTRGFVGGNTDPTGLTHLGAREYDPTASPRRGPS